MNKIIKILETTKCIQFGEFTFVSGQKSNIYIDIRRLTSNPKSLQKIAKELAKLTKKLNYDAIGAIPTAGLPLGTALSLITNKPLIYVRDKPKNYGTNSLIEGGYEVKGKKILLIDDVITNGESKLKAAKTLRKANAIISDLVIVVDRRPKPNTKLKNISVHSLLTLNEIMQQL